MEDPSSDKSGTDDSDAPGNAADINDVNSYEHVFKPRRRELNRTPTRDMDSDPPFEAPSGSESELPSLRPSNLRLSQTIAKKKKPSPSPTRRCSQPSMSASSPTSSQVPLRVRRTSTSTRPISNVYDSNMTPSPSAGHLSSSANRNVRSTSVQPRSAAELDYR